MNDDMFVAGILTGILILFFCLGATIGALIWNSLNLHLFEKGYCTAIGETYLDSDSSEKTFSCVDDWGNVTKFYKTEVGKTWKVFKKEREGG